MINRRKIRRAAYEMPFFLNYKKKVYFCGLEGEEGEEDPANFVRSNRCDYRLLTASSGAELGSALNGQILRRLCLGPFAPFAQSRSRTVHFHSSNDFFNNSKNFVLARGPDCHLARREGGGVNSSQSATGYVKKRNQWSIGENFERPPFCYFFFVSFSDPDVNKADANRLWKVIRGEMHNFK